VFVEGVLNPNNCKETRVKKSLEEQIPMEITMAAREDTIPALIEFVCDQAREMMFRDERIAQIRSALEEALGNIVRFACVTGSETITITAAVHDTGALLLDIVDTGVPFNMLVMSAFPETTDFAEAASLPSTKTMKKAIRNIEYRRDGDLKRNILAWVVHP
jgi:anti-sigma regulatory factor (Ser/Thr protein kinase)